MGRNEGGFPPPFSTSPPGPARPDYFPSLGFPLGLQLSLKPGDFVGGISGVDLGDIPMLDDARAIEAIDIGEGDGAGVILDAQMDEADIVGEDVALDLELGVRDDGRELGGVGVAALRVERVVLE